MQIKISVADKIATAQADAEIVCGNSDYEIAFEFDEMWIGERIKTARFVYQRQGKTLYDEVAFTGAVCRVPVLYDILEVRVGVYAGDLSTSTPAVVKCKRSILCGDPVHDFPPADVYNELVKMTSDALAAAEDAKRAAESIEEIVGDIDVELDEILELQRDLLGGDAE